MTTGLLLTLVTKPALVNADEVMSLTAYLLKPGEMTGFTPGDARVYRSATAFEKNLGDKPKQSRLKIGRYEDEGFVEAARVRMHSWADQTASGISNAMRFGTPIGANAEMKAQWQEALDRGRGAVRGAGSSSYLILRRFRIPGVPGAAAFAVTSNRAADRLGVESGVAEGIFAEGSCVLSVANVSLSAKNVIQPVISGIQAIHKRTGGDCP
jgi:hypothetical protein